jgi:hypothetical protein
LKADYEPAGDQPQAIAKLVEGIEDGFKYQTLLGVTGSGKSIGYDDPLYIEEKVGGLTKPRIVKAGPFIDAMIDAVPFLNGDSETERFACAEGSFSTNAFDPATGIAGQALVGAFLRHKAPDAMFRLTTACGRVVTLTDDHNLWVLRGGKLTLVRTDEVLESDQMPARMSFPILTTRRCRSLLKSP